MVKRWLVFDPKVQKLGLPELVRSQSAGQNGPSVIVTLASVAHCTDAQWLQMQGTMQLRAAASAG